MQRQFKEFRAHAEKEVAVHDQIHKKHEEMIAKLKHELKQAKTIINSPRIYQKFRNALSNSQASVRMPEPEDDCVEDSFMVAPL